MPTHTLFVDTLLLQAATWIQLVDSVLLCPWLNPHFSQEASGSISFMFWDSASSLSCVKYASDFVLRIRQCVPKSQSPEIHSDADYSVVEASLETTSREVSVGLGRVLDGLTAHRTEVLHEPNGHFLLLLNNLPNTNFLPLHLDFSRLIFLIIFSVLGSTQLLEQPSCLLHGLHSTKSSSLKTPAYSIILFDN